MNELPTLRELFNSITNLDMPSDETLVEDVASYVLENRSVQMRRDKKNPADCEMRRARDDKAADALCNSDDDDTAIEQQQ